MVIEDLSPCEHRRRFVLLDLYEQLDAVNRYIAGWSVYSIADWLWLYGEIRGPHYQVIGWSSGGQGTVHPLHVEVDAPYKFVPYVCWHDLYVYAFRVTQNGVISVTFISKSEMSKRRKIGQNLS